MSQQISRKEEKNMNKKLKQDKKLRNYIKIIMKTKKTTFDKYLRL